MIDAGASRVREPDRRRDPEPAKGPLAGIKVLDLSGLLPGPYASQLLADLGADVIKVESRLGDLMRQIPPLIDGQGAYFIAVNRGKRSLGLDLRRPGAAALFLRLARRSHVVIESFRPGRAERLGVGPQPVLEANPSLVYCRLSGFGQAGPDKERPGHDLTYLARAGALGSAVPPQVPPLPVADLASGTTAALAICAGLHRSQSTGRGSVIDLAIFEVAAAWAGIDLGAMTVGGRSGASPLSSRYPFYAIYPTADGGWLALGALEPLFWRDFCRAIERDDLADRQFEGGAARARLFEEVASAVAARTTAEWRRLIQVHNLSAEVVADLVDVPLDPQLVARGAVQALPGTGSVGPIEGIRSAFGAAARASSPPPGLAEHTLELLKGGFDVSEAEIDNLLKSNVIFGLAAPGRRIAPEQLT